MAKVGITVFEYSIPASVTITYPLIRKTLKEVQGMLLSRHINGGSRRLDMTGITSTNACGMAACIGGWASLLLLGFEKTRDNKLEHPADDLFNVLISVDDQYGNGLLSDLFHSYGATENFNEPNVAATAIGRYLRGVAPWPNGNMPRVMEYTRRRAPAKKKAKRK